MQRDRAGKAAFIVYQIDIQRQLSWHISRSRAIASLTVVSGRNTGIRRSMNWPAESGPIAHLRSQIAGQPLI